MTLPTLTYGQGLHDDCSSFTVGNGWGLTNYGLKATPTCVIVNNNLFKITGEPDTAGDVDEYCVLERDISDIDPSSSTYTKYLFRWKTSHAATALGARVKLIFDAGSQWLLGETEPQFNTTWQVEDGTITPGKIVKKIQFWADDYPNTVATGESNVYYDFILFHEGTFTFPFFRDIYPVKLHNDYPSLHPPGRVGEILQYLGMDNITFELTGDMMAGETWGSATGASVVTTAMTYGEFLIRLFSEAANDVWQWLSSDLGSMKVVPLDFELGYQQTSGAQRMWRLMLKEFSLGTFNSSDISLSASDRFKYRLGLE